MDEYYKYDDEGKKTYTKEYTLHDPITIKLKTSKYKLQSREWLSWWEEALERHVKKYFGDW